MKSITSANPSPTGSSGPANQKSRLPLWMTNERSAWRPARRITISEWADSHRVLDQRFAAEPGQWRTDRTPYVREWMNAARSKNCRRITILASTQVGKTDALNNIAGFFMHQEPSPIIVSVKRETHITGPLITRSAAHPQVAKPSKQSRMKLLSTHANSTGAANRQPAGKPAKRANDRCRRIH